jgi:predicted dienelactone hydrolase
VAIVSLLAVAVIGSGAPSASAKQSQDGPYAIGMRSYTFVDKSRPTAPNGTYPGASSRTLPTMLLYPARGRAGGAAVENARPLATKGGFPLIVFSHGFGANGPAYKPLLELLVRRGYVVAAPTFPLSSSGAPGGPKLGDYVNQPGDVSYEITRVLRLRRNHRGLAKTISRDHIGAAGHSLGAITTYGVAFNSCCLDRRIDAAVPISGILLPFGTGTFFTKPTPPLLAIHGNQDGTVPYSASADAYSKAPAPKALLTLDKAPHTPFSAPWLDPIVRTTTDFLDGYLKGDRKALKRLGKDGNVAGVSSLQQKLSRRAKR